MNRNNKIVYLFIYDDAKHFYRAVQQSNGSWKVTSNSQMYPLKHNPSNLKDCPVEFATNQRYFSMNRTINYPLEFIHDGAAILNSKYLLGKGINENLYLAIFEFDTSDGIYKLSYNGRFDFQTKKRNEKSATFTVSIVDDSAWGILSQNDDVQYSIDCSESNPKAIKVLFDNFTLKNRYTFQTVQTPITRSALNNSFVLPFVLVNQDGDSAGLVTKSQTYDSTNHQFVEGANTGDLYSETSVDYFLYSFYQINNVNIQGSFKFSWTADILYSGGLYIFFRTSEGQYRIIFTNQFVSGGPPAYALTPGQIYNADFNFNINLAPGEKIFFFAQLNSAAGNHFTITPIVTNIFVSTLTKAEPAICYALRPLDLLKSIVQKGTFDRYTIDSDFFSINNKTVLIPGEQFRGVQDSKIYTSFRDFFETFSALFFMALRVVNGSLFMELADEVYKKDTNIIDIGELLECETVPATEFFPNEIEVGSPKQDYRHPSGRLESNSINTFSLPFTNIKNKTSFVTKYRTDPYGMIFLLLDYKGQSTTDNVGDKSVFVVDITDDQATATEDVETFENINVDNAPLAPIIKYPLTGDIINNDKPLLKGIGIPGTNVNIYIADVLDGGTVVDLNGNWEYQIVTSLPSYDPGVFDGISVINATNTDMGGALDTIQLIIDTTVPAAIGITYPRSGDSLYNNLPLIKGVAPNGTNIDIFLDGSLLASVVADNSCKFEYKVVVPFTNSNHILTVNGIDTAFSIKSFVAFPLITYIGSELDGFPIVNNLPLIKGVAIPGTVISLWLNYIRYASMTNTLVTADVNGNWEFQVVPVQYPDPLSGIMTDLTPIRNGLSIISTLLINNVVKINVTGYKLNRPAYTSITGVLDDTIFNTRLSPKRMMLNHKSLLSAIMNQQRNDLIKFETADKNSNMRTVLGTEIIAERSDISPSSLGAPIALLEYANIKAIARKSFAAILFYFNNGGTVKGTFKGNTIYFLPIGSMKMKSILDDIQEWKLLISPQTSYNQLLNLYKNGLTINIMQNSIFHSDCNTLHFVTYNYQQPAKYNFKEMYDDWFTERNDAWISNPQYIQKLQKTDVFRDQVITNGVGAMTLKMYRCKDATLVQSFDYVAVANPPIPTPEIVKEAVVDLSAIDEGQYFFIQYAGEFIVAISERIDLRTKWRRTILMESNHSVNKPGVFYSTGFKTILRIEGLVKKIQPSVNTIIAEEESGDTSILYSNLSRKRIIRYGTAQGLPDYLAWKMANGVTNDNCVIEGVPMVLQDGEKINPSEDIDGVPMYYYNVIMTMKENSTGKVFAGQEGAETSGVILIVDAQAIGLPAHSLINIEEN